MKDKRSDIRIPIIVDKVQIRTIGYLRELTLNDVAEGGIFVKVTDKDDFLPPLTPVFMEFKLPGDLGILELNGEIRRVNWKVSKKHKKEMLGMAIKFWGMPMNHKKIWDAFRIYLRNKQIITVSQRIIEEFFGPKK